MTTTRTATRLLRVQEAAEVLGLSRSKTYQLLASGALPSVTIGRSRRVSDVALEQYLEELTAQSQTASPRSVHFPRANR